MVAPAMTAVGPNTDSLARITEIARAAGDAILSIYERGIDRSHTKADGSPVTAADHAAERVILDALSSWDASIPVISEEADLPPYDIRATWKRFWLVDPLDGTKEFISRNGEFTVNIALIENGEPVLGVVYAPALDVMYAAARGLGAWRTEANGQPTRITHTRPSAGVPLTIVESRSHGSAELEAFLSGIDVAARVRIGSSLKFCWVADGRADIYPRLGPTMEWDVAAGDCVYRNSAVEGQHASPLTYNKPDLRNESFIVGGPEIRATAGAA
ncbi:MAG TPA: 3'(2'),5'-bisphosphate nucleotidase CysQ [Gemmatimonadaceae bacterium]|nr:3'(2'),5'-bisphosphate nucleotidase CysQ [Gemmatimonadaceae bacterium]